MSSRKDIASRAASGLRAFSSSMASTPVTVGFDGFVDSIIAVVDKRHGIDSYDPVRTIEDFGRKIMDAAGQSANYELAVKRRKLGGNGPIMANALANIGLPTRYIGALGYPEIDEVFEGFARKAEVHSICPPGYTDALEFEDGKLMLGKYESINAVHPERIDEVVGRAAFAELVAGSSLLGMVNWTMLAHMNEVFRRLIDDVLSKTSDPPLIFIDLADPEKRTREDLRRALGLMTEMQAHARVILGVNLKEAVQVAEALGIEVGADAEDEIERLAFETREALGLSGAVVHPRAGAAASIVEPGAGSASSARFAGPFTRQPKISTGAGDHFNAGFCVGRLAGLDVEAALCVGTATSGYYVREAETPTLEQLAGFCEELPAPDPSGGPERGGGAA